MPDEPEAYALLALMLLHDSRREARTRDGELVLLEDQDRSRWDRKAISEGPWVARSGDPIGCSPPRRVYQVQAAIAAVHAQAATPADTDWTAIATLYDALLRIQDTLVIRLNPSGGGRDGRGVEAGLALLRDLADRLATFHPYHVARGDLLRRAGRLAAADQAYEQALALCTNAVEWRYLQRRRGELQPVSSTEP